MFSRNRTRGARPDATFSFVGPEVRVTGDIETSGQLHIDGTVTGDVRCGALSQGESGAVHGNILAEEARLAGLVDGAVEAGILVFESTARVAGDVLYESLSIAVGAQIEGRLKRRKGEGGGSLAEKARKPPPAGLFANDLPTAEAAE